MARFGLALALISVALTAGVVSLSDHEADIISLIDEEPQPQELTDRDVRISGSLRIRLIWVSDRT